MPENSLIAIYTRDDSSVEIQVRTDGDTVWLTRHQLAELFDRDVKTIGKHVSNALKEELAEIPVVANFATTAADGKTYRTEHYNLDMILSVGYRVKSANGIKFRRWANGVLQKYLIDGYVKNDARLKQLEKSIEILSRSADDMVSGIADVLLQSFSAGLDLLDRYDHQSLTKPKGERGAYVLTYGEAREFVDSMSFAADSDLFGNEKDESFKGTLGAIYQSFGGAEVYPSLEEKAANLLYMTVKNHSFSDGNKRIAAALFVYFLDKNGALFSAHGRQAIDNNSLAAITLMIALSKPSEKEIMCALVMNMLCRTL
ncbi:MAG: virulence RhuM family protein [Oscillospiraceae bacterium]|jgi:prophage maintenance system killer protein|nr:virulence RhuM family protein [Oscillospiraceae bacterium]